MNTSRLNKTASSTATAAAMIPVKIQFRHMDDSRRVTWLVNQMIDKFSKFPIVGASATVVVDETHHKQKKGVFQVKVKLSVPGEPLYVAHSHEKTGMHDGVYSAIADVFESIERQLVKRHGKRSKRRGHRAYTEAA